MVSLIYACPKAVFVYPPNSLSRFFPETHYYLPKDDDVSHQVCHRKIDTAFCRD